MKELLLKNRISQDKRRREYSIDETYFKDGVLMHTIKKCVHSVRNEYKFRNWEDLLDWINIESEANPGRFKQVSMKTHIDTENGTQVHEMLVWGTIYANSQGQILAIDYVHFMTVIAYTQEGESTKRKRW